MDLRRLDPGDSRPEFTCGDTDLDDFYRNDSAEGGKQLLCVTYVLMGDNGKAVAFFAVSNDAIKREEVPKSTFKRLVEFIPHQKRYSSMPAAKIGRLAICDGSQRYGYGTTVLDFLKVWFTKGNKTGCRFLVVDAYNNGTVIKFYKKNGFRFLTSQDESKDTRIMYFDLIRFRE